MSKLYYPIYLSKVGDKTIIHRPIDISNPTSISIGSNSFIAHNTWMMGGGEGRGLTLKIGDNVQIGHFAHIIGRYSLIIENDVLIADRVFISDCTHNYEDISKPVLSQGTKMLGSVVIGEGSWIGENVCVLGVSIGKHCVIGANSVVNQSIPDYCVAVGSPARVIKKYDLDRHAWRNV